MSSIGACQLSVAADPPERPLSAQGPTQYSKMTLLHDAGPLGMKPHHVKWFYLVVFALTVIATWILRDYSASALQKVHFLSYCKYELALGT